MKLAMSQTMQGAEHLECCYFKVSVTFDCGQSRVAKLQAVTGMGLHDTGFAYSLKAAQRLDGTDESAGHFRQGNAQPRLQPSTGHAALDSFLQQVLSWMWFQFSMCPYTISHGIRIQFSALHVSIH